MVDMSKIAEIESAQAKLHEEMKRVYEQSSVKAQTILKDVFVQMFEKYPFVKCYAWTQFTPYFNDGDPCVFGVNDLIYDYNEYKNQGYYQMMYDVGTSQLTKPTEHDYQLVRGEIAPKYAFELNSAKDTIEVWERLGAQYSEQVLLEFIDDYNRINHFLYSCSKILELAFGDHVAIYVTPKGIDVEEFQHD